MQAAATITDPPIPPPVPPQPVPVVTFTDINGTVHDLVIPRTAQAVSDLKQSREQLSNQLISASDRRHKLSEELRSAPAGPSRTGLEQRMAVLDKRIVQLESDIASTGLQLAAAPGTLLDDPWQGPSNGNDLPDNAAALGGAITVFVFFPIAIAIARNIWRRGNKKDAAPAQLPADTAQRLERVEQGVEAIAIEIERVAEGQRFVTRLLSEGQGGMRLGMGEETRVGAARP